MRRHPTQASPRNRERRVGATGPIPPPPHSTVRDLTSGTHALRQHTPDARIRSSRVAAAACAREWGCAPAGGRGPGAPCGNHPPPTCAPAMRSHNRPPAGAAPRRRQGRRSTTGRQPNKPLYTSHAVGAVADRLPPTQGGGRGRRPTFSCVRGVLLGDHPCPAARVRCPRSRQQRTSAAAAGRRCARRP
jgi:hypothetical protein